MVHERGELLIAAIVDKDDVISPPSVQFWEGYVEVSKPLLHLCFSHTETTRRAASSHRHNHGAPAHLSPHEHIAFATHSGLHPLQQLLF